MSLPTAFSTLTAFSLALWIYMVHALVVLPTNSPTAHMMAMAGSMLAALLLEWLRSRGNRDYATAFFILVTIAPLLYAYQHA